MAIYLNEQDVTNLLTMEDALSAVEAVFNLQSSGEATNEPRRRVHAAGASLNVMSGAVERIGTFRGVAGLKAYTVTRHGAIFHVSLYDAESGELLAFMEANKLGQMRTGAASGIATKYLANPDAKSVGLYGSGWQASSQLEAVCAVRPIEVVKVYSRSAEKCERFCRAMSAKLNGLKIEPVGEAGDAAGCEIIITITSAREPVLEGARLQPGAHINAAGNNSILKREFDDEVIKRAAFIAVDSLDQARFEAGELINPVEKGLLTWERVKELRYVVSGQIKGRTDREEITLFKSLGIAIEDVAAAAIVYQKARAEKLGKEM